MTPVSAVSPITPARFTLDDRYSRLEGVAYLTGIQALVRVLVDRSRLDRRAGQETAILVSGYEGSPLAGLDLEIIRRRTLMEEHGVVHQPGLNEELAATALAGTQLARRVGTLNVDAVSGFWYGKSPGLDRASDAIRHANLVGTDPKGGVVALVGDDPAAKSSSVPCVSEMALADLHLPTFYPADSQEVLDFGRHALELSRACGLWTALKVTTNVADGASTALLDDDWAAPDLTANGLKPYTHQPDGHSLGARLAVLERSLYDVRLPLAAEYARVSGVNRIDNPDTPARVGIVAAGKTYLDVRQALDRLGIDQQHLSGAGVRLLKLGMVYPVDPTVVREFASGLDEILVVEEKRAFIESTVRDVLYGHVDAPAVYGKRGPDGGVLVPASGELDSDVVGRLLARRLRAHGIALTEQAAPHVRSQLPVVSRTPYFCSGCPHNSSTKVPDGSLVGAGIGCHTMVLLMPEEQVGAITGLSQMGGEGLHWVGMAPFVREQHFLQNLGDGTFAHSGSLAIRAAVAANANITYKLLYNSTVAMTGGQAAVGGLPIERVASLLLDEGVGTVVITSDRPKRLRRRVPRGVQVRHRDDLLDLQTRLAATPGVTVLIHEQECAAEKRRKRRRGKLETPPTRVLINERVCEGCGDCGQKSNCLSVQPVDTDLGRKTRIHQSSCNLDYSCLSGDCPSFLTVVPGKARVFRPLDDLAPDAVADPEQLFSADQFAMRITGVGGTGVVTVAQVLATAAVIDGRSVRALDQTGLAQKGGAVVSDIKMTKTPRLQASKLGAGECDLYLACDSLVAVDPVQLAVADPARTVAVVSTAEVPTGRMVVDTQAHFPAPEEISGPLESATAGAHYLDARGLSEHLFDDDQFANMLLVGAAYQSGALPVTASAIERAIELNGAAVDQNLQAFRRGRQAIAHPDALLATAPERTAGGTLGARERARAAELLAGTDIPPSGSLREVLDHRVGDLVAYQNVGYAARYLDFVVQVWAAEKSRVPGSTAVTEAVARHLYKLMAYKDEYEVARLSLDPSLDAAVSEQFGEGARYSYRLHPPVFRALGLKRKLSLGRWFRPAFGALRTLRVVRGTPFDVFGYAHVRRVERQLVVEYRSLVERALCRLDRDTVAEVVSLAELPDMVRGYEDIKLRNVESYRARAAELEDLLVGRTERLDRKPLTPVSE
jgi:indolepyruvate ferredoxin oxidoreductase